MSQPDFATFSQACATMASELEKMPNWDVSAQLNIIVSKLTDIQCVQVKQQLQLGQIFAHLEQFDERLTKVQQQQKQALLLINIKDNQQRARQINYNSMHNADKLEGLPNEEGDVPSTFPNTRLDFRTLDDSTVCSLLNFYKLPHTPARNRKERLGRHIGLRLS